MTECAFQIIPSRRAPIRNACSGLFAPRRGAVGDVNGIDIRRQRLADAERRAVQIIEEAKGKANELGVKIVVEAKAEAAQATVAAREALREEVAALAVKGAEQILRREVNASVHAELLGRLKAEL